MSSANTDNKYKRKRLPLNIHKDYLQRLLEVCIFWYVKIINMNISKLTVKGWLK